jgi:hypothetical protein
MEIVGDALSALGVLMLPIASALLLEEILFGGLAQLLFAPRRGTSQPTERSTQGEISCSR